MSEAEPAAGFLDLGPPLDEVSAEGDGEVAGRAESLARYQREGVIPRGMTEQLPIPSKSAPEPEPEVKGKRKVPRVRAIAGALLAFNPEQAPLTPEDVGALVVWVNRAMRARADAARYEGPVPFPAAPPPVRPPPKSKEPPPCDHPRTRRLGGACLACGRIVEGTGRVIPLGTVAVLFLLTAWGVPKLTGYAAHVGRYRRYRRSYPRRSAVSGATCGGIPGENPRRLCAWHLQAGQGVLHRQLPRRRRGRPSDRRRGGAG